MHDNNPHSHLIPFEIVLRERERENGKIALTSLSHIGQIQCLFEPSPTRFLPFNGNDENIHDDIQTSHVYPSP